MNILNKSKNTVLARTVMVADTFWTRLVGLIGKKDLPPVTALVVTRCQSIHMLFMRFPIDAVFADRHHRVVGCVEAIKPFRLSPIFFHSRYVIELRVGTITATKTSPGDQLEWLSEEEGNSKRNGC